MDIVATCSKAEHYRWKKRKLVVIHIHSHHHLKYMYIDIQEITLKSIFSTNYILENKDQPENIKNIADLTEQVIHLSKRQFICITLAFFL